jgi:hypothetical protein
MNPGNGRVDADIWAEHISAADESLSFFVLANQRLDGGGCVVLTEGELAGGIYDLIRLVNERGSHSETPNSSGSLPGSGPNQLMLLTRSTHLQARFKDEHQSDGVRREDESNKNRQSMQVELQIEAARGWLYAG